MGNRLGLLLRLVPRRRTLRTLRRQRRRWVRPITQPLILVSEIHRSGGTLLSQLLDGHAECFAHPYEIAWGKPKRWNWPHLDLSARSATVWFERRRQAWLAEYARRGSYAKSPLKEPEQYPFLFDVALQRQIFTEQIQRDPPSAQRHVLQADLTSLFHAWMDYQNLYAEPKKYVTGFTPRLLMHDDSVGRFWQDYPDGYLVTLIRGPASWYASAIGSGYRGDLPAVMQQWNDSVLASFRAKDRWPERVIVLRFEDLVKQTEVVMRHVCQITGLTCDACLFTPTFNSMPIKPNSRFPGVDRVDVSVVDRYKHVLAAADIDAIATIGADTYRRAAQYIGYSAAR